MPGNQEFFDNPEVLARYLAHRDRPDNPNDTLERPIFLELAGNFSNLDIVDLGCGNTDFGKEALLQGAHSYTGIEVSRAMVNLALETLANTSGKVHYFFRILLNILNTMAVNMDWVNWQFVHQMRSLCEGIGYDATITVIQATVVITFLNSTYPQ